MDGVPAQLARRGRRGVKLVVSDSHEGIKATVGTAATLGVIVSIFISYVVTRTLWRGRSALDIMA